MRYGAKCVIFPKGKTTWEGFVPPCQFKGGDVVFYNDTIAIFKEWGDETLFRAYVIKYLYKDSAIIRDIPLFGKSVRKEIRFATEEEKEKLFDAIKTNGYKWNTETKTLEKLIEPIFEIGNKIRAKHNNNNNEIHLIKDVKDDYYVINGGNSIRFCGDEFHLNFKHQDEYVLVPNKFDITTLKPFDKVLVRTSHMAQWKADFFSHYVKEADFPYNTVGRSEWCYCIPYKSNEYLLGTTNDCDDYYKTWK